MTGDLAAIVEELGSDERRVLLALGRRLLDGQRQYGRLDVAKDPRHWRAERGEELCDVLIYSAIAEVAALAKLDTLAAEHPELLTQSTQQRLAATPR